jgi:cytochrome d ubiquinol oxidase subunit I
VLAEIRRQPWAVDGVLPTFLGAFSPHRSADLDHDHRGFTALYGSLAVIEVRLMLASIRKGPIEHHPAEADSGCQAPAE